VAAFALGPAIELSEEKANTFCMFLVGRVVTAWMVQAVRANQNLWRAIAVFAGVFRR